MAQKDEVCIGSFRFFSCSSLVNRDVAGIQALKIVEHKVKVALLTFDTLQIDEGANRGIVRWVQALLAQLQVTNAGNLAWGGLGTVGRAMVSGFAEDTKVSVVMLEF